MSDLSSPEPLSPPSSNAAAFTVTELAATLKRTVEDAFGYVRVKGEISQPKIPGSGHCYLRLKDENACIDGIIWRGTLSKLSIRPEEGMEVIATGRLTTYPARSSYQIIIESLELAGQGALLKLLEDRRKKLAAEGLFDEARKKPLPYLPGVIGVVTSPTGAVIRDILHRLADRFPRRVIVWPVKVQGEGAAEEIAAAIAGFNALAVDGAIPRPDVIIVARGGGSLEDLWAFNEEVVVRAGAASLVPLISAVGHETDWTLIDLAADRRAPTPTAAAEMAVPVRLDLLAEVQQRHGRLMQAVTRTLEERRIHLEGLVRGIPRLDMIVAQKTQDLDALGERLAEAPQRLLAAKSDALLMLSGRLALDRFAADLRRHAVDLQNLTDRALRALARASTDAGTRLANVLARLESVSPRRVLERGYAMVRDAGGGTVTSIAGAAAGASLKIEFADGDLPVRVESGRVEGAASKPARPAPKKDSGTQGTLLLIRSGVFLIAALISVSAFADDGITFAGRLEQGGLVVGTAPPGTTVTYNGTNLHLTPDGHFLVGIGRDAPAHVDMKVTTADGKAETKSLAIAKRDWETERVDGVPQQLVTPDPVLAAKIGAENKLMYAAYMKLELTPFFEKGFIRPAEGRISGVFGSQRILNGTPLAPHTGLDIAGGMGGQVHAAADGIVTLAHPMMVMTGNTVVLNHGYGLETIYIHMSKIFVSEGQQVKQGDVIGEIGMTGRANGPHLHFGATWFNTRLDPATLLDVLPAPAK